MSSLTHARLIVKPIKNRLPETYREVHETHRHQDLFWCHNGVLLIAHINEFSYNRCHLNVLYISASACIHLINVWIRFINPYHGYNYTIGTLCVNGAFLRQCPLFSKYVTARKKCFFLILIHISRKFVPKGQINDTPEFVRLMTWIGTSPKPLCETILATCTSAYMLQTILKIYLTIK